MPRDAAGVYTLPNADVIGGTTITTAWANSTMSDLAVAMTQSLSREGDGGMNAPLQFDDGTEAAPAITWVDELGSGFRRFGAGDMRGVILGEDKVRFINDAVNPAGSEKPFLIWDGLAWREANYGTPVLEIAFSLRINQAGTILSSFNVASVLGGGSATAQINFTDAVNPSDIVLASAVLASNSLQSNLTFTTFNSGALSYRSFEFTGGVPALAAKDVSVIGYLAA